MNGTALHFRNAIKKHNNTIKTHFKLNDAYNIDVISKIDDSMKNMNKLKGQNKIMKETASKTISSQQSYAQITKNEIVLRHIGTDLETFGEISNKPLHFRQRYSKQAKVFVNNIPTGKQEDSVRKQIASILTSVMPNSKSTIFANKIKFDDKTHDVRQAVYIINTPDIMDTMELNKATEYFLGIKAKKNSTQETQNENIQTK